MSSLDRIFTMKILSTGPSGVQTVLTLQEVGGQSQAILYVPADQVQDLDLGQTFNIEVKANPSP
jgi:hypothetical protein